MYSLTQGADGLGFPPSAPLPSFDTASVQSVLENKHLGLRVRYVDSIDTTMNVAKWARDHGEPCSPGLVLIAGAQPSGIGYRGSWQTIAHQDVMMTMVVKDVATVEEMRRVQFCSALATCVALEQILRNLGKFACPFADRPFVFKYPNDVYAHTQPGYKKISGSMCIGSTDSRWKKDRKASNGIEFPKGVALLGIGINLATQLVPPGYVGPPRITFQELAGELVPREPVIIRVLDAVCESLARLESDPDELCRSLVPHFSINSGSPARVEYVGDVAPKFEVLTFQELESCGVTFLRDEKKETIPHARIDRIVAASSSELP